MQVTQPLAYGRNMCLKIHIYIEIWRYIHFPDSKFQRSSHTFLQHNQPVKYTKYTLLIKIMLTVLFSVGRGEDNGLNGLSLCYAIHT